MSVPLSLKKPHATFATFFKSGRWVVAVGLIVLLGIGVGLTRELVRRTKINAEVARLEQEIGGLEQRNEELGGLIEYFKSDAFLELEARARLNVQKPGEKVIEVQTSGASGGTTPAISPPAPEPQTNPARWLNYLFSQS